MPESVILLRLGFFMLSQLLPQMLCLMRVCVKIFPTFLESRHSSLLPLVNTDASAADSFCTISYTVVSM